MTAASVVHVLGNPGHRARGQTVDAVVATLRARGVGVEPIVADSVAASAERTSAVVRDGAERVIAVGGDGVVHLAVGAVARTATVLGIVPDGTGNDVARALGLLDGDLDARIERALADPVEVDAIRSDHGWIASVATLGFSGDVTARANAMRWPRGQARYTLATLLQLPRLRSIPVTVEVDGQVLTTSSSLLSVGNTAFFGGGMRICPGARPTDGVAEVVSIDAVPKRTFLRVFPQVFTGRHVDRPEVRCATGRIVRLTGDGADLWADGELLGPLPVTLETVPGAVRIAGATLPTDQPTQASPAPSGS
ncbi:MAG: diacylglycerol kinase family protein [Actinomycetota bacterium]